ncbi:rCG59329, partial [Rattus norvegicus]
GPPRLEGSRERTHRRWRLSSVGRPVGPLAPTRPHPAPEPSVTLVRWSATLACSGSAACHPPNP